MKFYKIEKLKMMTRTLFYFLIVMMISSSADAQKFFTREGKVSFFPPKRHWKKIEAHNSKATSVMDIKSGRMEFAILIKAFQFEKALMQEHFNENYLESDKFPKATFKGNILNIDAIDFSKDGEYDVTVAGDLTIHGRNKSYRSPWKKLWSMTDRLAGVPVSKLKWQILK